MPTLEDKFSSLYGTEAYGGVATVFLPGIQGASVAGPQGEEQLITICHHTMH